MENEINFKPRCASNSKALQALRLTKISLLIFILGIGLAGHSKAKWPFVSWILYSNYSARFRPPEPFVSDRELRVYTTTGELHIVKPEQILTLPRDTLSHKIVNGAFDQANVNIRDASRRYLIKAISDLIKTNSEIKTIEAWEMSYQVEPLAVPPIQLESPTSEVMLDSFSAEDFRESKR